MSELGSSAAVGIESVEWLDAPGGQLNVRVTGRWRRRRGWVESRGPSVLVIEVGGRRHRFPATPEPPSLAGAAPGTWRLTFAVPSELAPGLGGQVWLALGAVTVPLPVPESGAHAGPGFVNAETPAPPVVPAVPTLPEPAEPEGSAEPEESVEPAEPAEREEPAAILPPPRTVPPPAAVTHPPNGQGSLEIERAWRRADAAERTAASLGERLAGVERVLEEERSERAEEAARRGREDERPAEVARHDPAAGRDAEADRLRAEDALRAARLRAGVRIPVEPPAAPLGAWPGEPRGELARTWPSAGGDEVAALRHELLARTAAEARLRARTIQAETRLAARVLLEERTAQALVELRGELELLRDMFARERARREAAEAVGSGLRDELAAERARSREASRAIEDLRGALGNPGPGSGPGGLSSAQERSPGRPSQTVPALGGPQDPVAAGELVTPDRLSDAFARLRESAPPRDELPSEPGAQAPVPRSAAPGPEATRACYGPTVERAFRRLAGRDPDQAGRLLIGLLGAQRTASPRPVAYDLVLGPGRGCVQVTVGAGEGPPAVRRSGETRAREQVDFTIVGDPARLARLLTAGRLRRALRIGVARVRGRRAGLQAVRALLTLPLDLAALRGAGVSREPEVLLSLISAMIDPTWTRGESFVLSHTDERGRALYLEVRDGLAPTVSPAPPGRRVATELIGPADRLWGLLGAGPREPIDGTVDAPRGVRGDLGPLMLLRTWIERAQTG